MIPGSPQVDAIMSAVYQLHSLIWTDEQIKEKGEKMVTVIKKRYRKIATGYIFTQQQEDLPGQFFGTGLWRLLKIAPFSFQCIYIIKATQSHPERNFGYFSSCIPSAKKT